MNITPELAQAIVNYLQTKSFNEVHVLIAEIMKQAQVVPEHADTTGSVKKPEPKEEIKKK